MQPISMHTSVSTSPQNQHTGLPILVFLSVLMGFASISTDFYLPAMPAMQHDLHSNASSMEYTISGYLIGFSLGQLFWGIASDRYGRKMPLAAGLILFIIGSAGCALSHTVVTAIFWRIIQAVGACASVVIARAIVRDLYTGTQAVRLLSLLMTIMGIAPLLGPMIGGQIEHFFGWRSIFWLLTVIGFVTLGALWIMPETLALQKRQVSSWLNAFQRYGTLLKHRKIVALAGICGFFYLGTFAYVAATPFVYINYYHVPVRSYGFIFGVGILGIMATNLINRRLISRFGTLTLLKAGVYIAFGAATMLCVTSYTGWGGLIGLVVPLFIFFSMTGFIVANAIGLAMQDFLHEAGVVSAFIGSIQYGGGILGSAMVGYFANGTPWTLGWVTGLSAMGCLLSLIKIRRIHC